MKRIFDLIVALLLLPFAVILISIFSIILMFELREFPLFFQKRGITIHNHTFTLIKLKTIKTNVPQNASTSKDKNILIKPNLESFITPFAKWLRRTGLDELPQIFNIISGKMSFVGPRPLMMSDLIEMKKKFHELYKIRDEITAKPGLTGLWQIFGDREEDVRNLVALDKIYDEANSFMFDLKIFFFTIPVVLTGSNTDSILKTKKNVIINLFNLSSSTRFALHKKLTLFNQNKSDYIVEIPGDWWFRSSSVDTPIKFKDKKAKNELRKFNHG